ncbi:interleukin-17 receptor B-like isoform X1 [Huso huso]|uniref:Interleukin-17 receptor B-like isoform X1 n=1 Tax=Huso huso TaxID=61971 RepID=A0ABR0YMQ7_HUSHU
MNYQHYNARTFFLIFLSGWGPVVCDTQVLEQDIICEEHDAYIPPTEWTIKNNFTPSDLQSLKVKLVVSSEQSPTLNISWTISADGSIANLKATMIRIENLRNYMSHSFQCKYTQIFLTQTNPWNKKWEFYFSGFNAEPETHYYVSAFNIPTANIEGDPPTKSQTFKTPDCENDNVKYHEHCVSEGSLWEPNISSFFTGDEVEVVFTTSKHSLKYAILLFSCKKPSEKLDNCEFLNMITAEFQANETRSTKRIKANNKDCEILVIQIAPYFHGCQSDCHRHAKHMDCKIESPTETTPKNPDKKESQLLIIAATLVFAILLVVSIYAMWKSGKTRRCLADSASNNCSGSPATILIIYSLESRIFQKAVVAFAEFLQLHCQCKVIIDIWQTQKIAEMGQVQWLATQKETADKIVVICSNSANSKWNSTSNPTAEDYTVSTALEDMYSLTLNMFSSDLKCPAALNKYMVVYFDEISTGKNIPPAFSFCKSYSLMKEIGKICKSMHGAPDHRFSQDTDTLLCSKFPCNKESTQQLRNAILELKEWEKSMLV